VARGVPPVNHAQEARATPRCIDDFAWVPGVFES